MPTTSQAPGKPSRGVDTHARIFNQQLRFVRAGERYIPDHDATLETYLQKLDHHGLSNGILIQPSFLRDDNSNLLDAVASHPDRLRAIVITGPDTPLAELEAMKAKGVVGVRLTLYGDDAEDYGDARWRGFTDRLAELDLIVAVSTLTSSGEFRHLSPGWRQVA